MFRGPFMQISTPRRRLRKRGITIDSVMLGLVVALAVMPQIMGMVKRSYDIQQDETTGAELEVVADAARGYVSDRYDDIRRSLIARANDPAVNANAPLTIVLTPEDLALNGYLSRAFITATADPRNYEGQSYRLMIRAVLRSDSGFPQSTLTKDQIVTLGGAVSDRGTNSLNDNVVDSATGNDEMDIESVMVTTGGDPFLPIRAARVAAATKSPVVTDIREDSGDLVAVGNQGNFEIPLSEWQDIAADNGLDIEAGHLLSVVSLSGYSGYGAGGGNGETVDYRRTLLRCYGLTEGSSDYETCLEDNNDLWTHIVFNDLPDGSRPGIYNVGQITCDGDESAAIAGTDNVLSINCGTVAIGGNVTANNASLAEDLSLTGGDSQISMGGDNASINMTGSDAGVAITGENGRIDVAGENGVLAVSGDNGRIELQGNNIAEHLVLSSGVVAVGESIPFPATNVRNMCPSGRVQPHYTVTGAIESAGRAISGYRTHVANDNIARIIFFTSEDFCSTGRATAASPLTPLDIDGWDASDYEPGTYVQTVNNPDGSITSSYPNAPYAGAPLSCLNKPADVVLGSQADGYPDAYWVGDGQGLVRYEFMCSP